MGRAPCCDKANVKKGPWSPEEDSKLKEYIEKYGTGGNWIALPQKAGLKRCGKSCRLRWLNYLRPNIKHGEFSDEEDRIICTLFASIGSRWSIIAAQLPGRTDNDIKNYWNTKLKKKLMAMSPQSQRNNNKPLPFPSPPSFPSNYNSYPYNNNNNNNIKPFSTFFEPINSQIIPSNLFQIQQETLTSTISSPLQYYHPIKENNNNNNLLVFGSEASCSSNSDGSCSQISYGGPIREIKQELDLGFQSFISNGFEENHKFMLNYSNGGENLNQWAEKANGYFGETITAAAAAATTTTLEYDLEDVKQLISSSSTNGCNFNNNNNLLNDENKTQDKFMYYYD